ncbi:Uncharacterised protein [Amycolatopsis camponoti]|uniref:Protein kinase domain-containing protein n=1 Tax=Amycolatopsis camponoti TaxID=2606593 RepID=A0A6I8LHN4_9PSEU|nr:serine/threonine-protein kinase [Amycolatopsis camponoti]VVJ15547.1 Uncharacterised protein [Amycolatopsis camponoti]
MPADTQKLKSIALTLYPDAEVTHLGTGGFASTFKVQRGSDVFAVKILDPERTDVVRTEREFAALRRVSHKNVVAYRAIDAITIDDTSFQYVEMDYIDGAPLSKSLKFNDEFDLKTAASIMMQVVEGAAALWREQTAHRDLSPSNVMLTESGQVVIVDLGMARHVDDETHTLLPTPGTPGWMSPEQVSKSPQRGDWRSDQFVIGLLAWRLVTNSKPFGKVTGVELWSAPGVIAIPKAKDVNARVPAKLSNVLEKMTQQQPFKRYLDPEKLLEDVGNAVAALEGDGSDDNSNSLCFYLAVGQIKNVATSEFVTELGTDGLILDAAGCSARIDVMTQVAASSKVNLAIDPVSYLDRSPIEARSSSYKKLPYGQRARILEVPKSESARADYCRSIVEHQIDNKTDIVISPYFLADSGELEWIDESLSCAETCRDILQQAGHKNEVWSAVAVGSGVLSGGAGLEHLLNALTATRLPAVYLLVHTAQVPFAPLADEGTLRGIRDVIAVCREIESPIIIGRRDVSGLLALGLGASGWSTGVSANLENLPRHLEEVEDTRGGQAADRYYVPDLLNSLKIETHARLRRAGLLTRTYTKYDRDLFSSGRPIAQISTTEQRITLRQHNMQAKSDQVAELSSLEPSKRREWMKTKIQEAQGLYSKLRGIVDPAELGTFLEVWKKII